MPRVFLGTFRKLGAARLATLAFQTGAQPADPGRPRPIVDNYFGNVVEDPFRHLENLEDPAVAAWKLAGAGGSRGPKAAPRAASGHPLRRALVEWAPYGLRPGGRRLRRRGSFESLDDYTATEALVPSYNGAKLPWSIIHRRGLALDGSHPTLPWGCAAYGDTEAPWFSTWRLAWLEMGGNFAVASPRGSGAFGHAWYRASFQRSKPGSWKDFVACAGYLVAQHFTSPARLGSWSGSDGGLLVGRAMTERPELFAAVVSSAGLLDTAHIEAGLRALLAMSTHHQVRDGTACPAALFTRGLNDPRVAVWNISKTAARLARASTSSRPVLLRLDADERHGMGDKKAQKLAELTDTMLFLLCQFGLPA